MMNAQFHLSSLDGSNGFTLNGIDAYDRSGRSVSGAGDVNGDGIDDIIISADRANPNGIYSAGESYVVFGNTSPSSVLNLSSLDGSNGFTINGIDVFDGSGRSVSNAGDLNGDGLDDVIIASPYGSIVTGYVGESYVVFGNTNPSSVLNLSSLDGRNGFIIVGIDSYDYSGRSVSNAGDVNGDGFDDIILGAANADPNGNYNAGESYVVFGNSNSNSTFDLSSLDGSTGFTINGIDSYDYSGISVSNAGDVNGDGFDDIIIGAPYADPNGNFSAGESYVVFGSMTPSSTFNLSSLDGMNGFIIKGEDTLDYSGHSVSSAGDVNGDGFDDIIIGANLASPNGNYYAGESYVVFGSVSLSSTLDLSSLDGSNGFSITGIDEQDRSGFSVSSAGDINGDGFDDLIIGTLNANKSYVVFGSTTLSSSLSLSSIDGSNGFFINGVDAYDGSSRAVSGAGDLNGDGIDDIIVGAYLADPNSNTDAGESYVIFGSEAPVDIEVTLLNGTLDIRDVSGQTSNENLTLTEVGANLLISDPNLRFSSNVGTVSPGQQTVEVPLESITNPIRVFGFNGRDNINATALSLNTSIQGGNDDDTILGGAGDDYIRGDEGADSLRGGSGFDTIDFISENTAVNVNLTSHTISTQDTISGFENIFGTHFSDSITGNFRSNLLRGREGDDRLRGLDGSDTLLGGDDNDTLLGGNSSDRLDGGRDDDRLVGASGNDTLLGGLGNNVLLGGSGNDWIVGGNGNDRADGARGSDTISGGTGNDTLKGGAGQDRLKGLAGDDLILGNRDDDTLLGGTDNDTLRGLVGNDILNGNAGNDRLMGDGGSDIIIGGQGSDTLSGNVGNDRLIGSNGTDVLMGAQGNDFLRGGADADQFIFTGSFASLGQDRIWDMTSMDQLILGRTTFALAGPVGSNILASEFERVTTNGAAALSSAKVVYNTTNGFLFYNPNGAVAGFASGGQFATLVNQFALSRTNITLSA